VLSDREFQIAVLSGQGVPRAQIAQRYGLSVRSVERCLERAQRKLDGGLEVMSTRGRCAMLALTIADIKTGRIRPGHPRYDSGNHHLGGCWGCRATTAIDARQAA
jgi:transposase